MQRCLTILAAVALLSCEPLSTDPDEVVSIEFPLLPFPAIVVGDSLRDTTGAVVPLVARLFTADGDAVESDSITFLSLDSTATIAPGNVLVGSDSLTGQARLLATGAGLQSVQRTIQVVPKPDTLVVSTAPDTLRFLVPDDAQNKSKPFAVTLKSFDSTTATYKAVPRWPIRFRVEFRGVTIEPGDTSVVYLLEPKAAADDTTDGNGVAQQSVRYRVTGDVAALDSIIVFAEARYKGALVGGSAVRMVIPVRPR